MIDRRQFTLGTAAAAAALVLPARLRAAGTRSTSYKFCAFTKYVQELDYEQLADAMAEAGFDGVEVTARRSASYIDPQRAADELPPLHEALARRGLEISILTTDVLRADEPHAEPMLRAAAELGVERYRLGFWRYDLAEPVVSQLAALEPVVRDLAAMNRELGIAAVYQNHAGANYVGATMWDLHRLIEEYPASEIGCVFDIRHSVVEAGEAWPVYFNLMKPHLAAVSVKDFRWNERRSRHAPLGEGRVDPKFFKMLQQTDFAGPISLHVEYLPRAGTEENLAALVRDLQTLRGWL